MRASYAEFERSAVALNAEQREKLGKDLAWLRDPTDCGDEQVVLTIRTSPAEGTSDRRLVLGQARAAYVQTLLTAYGVSLGKVLLDVRFAEGWHYQPMVEVGVAGWYGCRR